MRPGRRSSSAQLRACVPGAGLLCFPAENRTQGQNTQICVSVVAPRQQHSTAQRWQLANWPSHWMLECKNAENAAECWMTCSTGRLKQPQLTQVHHHESSALKDLACLAGMSAASSTLGRRTAYHSCTGQESCVSECVGCGVAAGLHMDCSMHLTRRAARPRARRRRRARPPAAPGALLSTPGVRLGPSMRSSWPARLALLPGGASLATCRH